MCSGTKVQKKLLLRATMALKKKGFCPRKEACVVWEMMGNVGGLKVYERTLRLTLQQWSCEVAMQSGPISPPIPKQSLITLPHHFQTLHFCSHMWMWFLHPPFFFLLIATFCPHNLTYLATYMHGWQNHGLGLGLGSIKVTWKQKNEKPKHKWEHVIQNRRKTYKYKKHKCICKYFSLRARVWKMTDKSFFSWFDQL